MGIRGELDKMTMWVDVVIIYYAYISEEERKYLSEEEGKTYLTKADLFQYCIL